MVATVTAASFLDREAAVVCHGVNTEKFSPPEDRATAWAKRKLSSSYGIGVLGRVRPQKGTEEFVDAISRVPPERPEWTAVIIGQTTEQFRAFKQRLRGEKK